MLKVNSIDGGSRWSRRWNPGHWGVEPVELAVEPRSLGCRARRIGGGTQSHWGVEPDEATMVFRPAVYTPPSEVPEVGYEWTISGV